MRDMRCRAKETDSTKWVEGYYVCFEKVTLCPINLTKEDIENNKEHYIMFDGFSDWNLATPKYQADILPETLCQITGNRDVNHKEIYENDYISDGKTLWKVIYSKTSNGFLAEAVGGEVDSGCSYFSLWHLCNGHNEKREIRVVGNVFDNEIKKLERELYN